MSLPLSRQLPVLGPALFLLAANCVSPDESVLRGRQGKADDPAETDVTPPQLAMQLLVSTWAASALESQGISGMQPTFNGTEVFAQIQHYANEIGFEQGFSLALSAFLTDEQDGENVAALLRYDDGADWQNDPYCSIQDVPDRIRCYMALPGAVLKFLHRDPDHPQSAYPPESGETPEEYWVFELQLNELSDHSHWACVPRRPDADGQIQVRTSSFN